jgi:hypothetical protein
LPSASVFLSSSTPRECRTQTKLATIDGAEEKASPFVAKLGEGIYSLLPQYRTFPFCEPAFSWDKHCRFKGSTLEGE